MVRRVPAQLPVLTVHRELKGLKANFATHFFKNFTNTILSVSNGDGSLQWKKKKTKVIILLC